MSVGVLILTFSPTIYLQPKIIRHEDLVLLNGNKDSSVAAMNTIDYINIMQEMIHDGIKNKIY